MGDSEQWAQWAHGICGQPSGNDEASSKAAWKDEKNEVTAADMKKDAVLPEENTAIRKIFKDRTCVQDEEISETKHRWLLSSETQTAAESWRLFNFMVLSYLRGRLYAYPDQLWPEKTYIQPLSTQNCDSETEWCDTSRKVKVWLYSCALSAPYKVDDAACR